LTTNPTEFRMARSTQFTDSRASRRRGVGTARPDAKLPAAGSVRRGERGKGATFLNAQPEGESYDRSMEMKHVGLFSAGLAIGLAVGAGVALLLAPKSGEDTREWIEEAVSDRWDSLRDEVGRLARRGKRKAGRKLTTGRWALQDFRDRH
ncbi:MAG: YtxH domain-containing protein, partial [Gemmatimonadota bacterium]|nr:YtxH domain-containing protein [Gemmatimonadota bacterium]